MTVHTDICLYRADKDRLLHMRNMYKYYKHRHKFIKIMEENAKYHSQH